MDRISGREWLRASLWIALVVGALLLGVVLVANLAQCGCTTAPASPLP